MAEIIINDVKYTNVPNKKAGTKFASALTQSNIGMSQAVQDYVNSSYFYALINAIDINWDGIDIGENSYINTTSDLIKWIESKAGDIDLSSYATVTYVNQKIEDLIGGAPETLDTLKELADALQEDASLAYVTQALDGKADKTQLNDYTTVTYVTTELEKKANLSDIPSAPDLTPYVTYADANTYYACKNEIPDVSNYLTYADANSYYVSQINSYIGHYDSTDAECTYIGKDEYNAHNNLSQYYSGLATSLSKSKVFMTNPISFSSFDSKIGGNNLVIGGFGSDSSIGNMYVSASDSLIFGYGINAYLWISDASSVGYSNDRRRTVSNVVAIGHGLNITNNAEIAFGVYNSSLEGNFVNYQENKMNTGSTLFTIGNGTGKYDRHNALDIRRNGMILIADTFDGTPYLLQSKLVHNANIDLLKNVNITNVQDGQILTYSGTQWVNTNASTPDMSSYATNSQLDNRTLLVKDETITTFGEHTLNDITEFDLKVNFIEDDDLHIYIHANNIDSNSVTLTLYFGSYSQTEQDESFEVTATYVGRDENNIQFWHVTCNAPVDSISFVNASSPSQGIEFEMSYGSSITVIENFDNYVSYSQANSYYVAKEDMPDYLSNYVTYTQANSYYATPMDISSAFGNLQDIVEHDYVSNENLSSMNYISYSQANSYYVDINSYNALYTEVQHLAYLISYYHPSTPDPTPGGKTQPQASWTNTNEEGQCIIVAGDTTPVTCSFTGTPSSGWSASQSPITGITVNTTTLDVTIDPTQLPSDFVSWDFVVNYSEDSSYYAGTGTLGIFLDTPSGKLYPSAYFVDGNDNRVDMPLVRTDEGTELDNLTLTLVTDPAISGWTLTPPTGWSNEQEPEGLWNANNHGVHIVNGNTITFDAVQSPENNYDFTWTCPEDSDYYSDSIKMSIVGLDYDSDTLFFPELGNSDPIEWPTGAETFDINFINRVDCSTFNMSWSSDNPNVTVTKGLGSSCTITNNGASNTTVKITGTMYCTKHGGETATHTNYIEIDIH